MARIKFGSIITSGSGSLGGHVIQNSKGGPQLRTKPLPIGNPSAAQRLIRSFNPILQYGWRNLSEANQKIWNNFAPPKLSGHSVWMKLQYQYVSVGNPFQLDPYIASLGPYGPELIKNGSFNNSDHWAVYSYWSISGGTANYNSVSSGRMHTDIILKNSHSYQLKFDILNCPTTGQIGFYKPTITQIFQAPYNIWINVVNGSYTFDVNCILDTTVLALWGYTYGDIFSIDNLSIKEAF